METYVARTPTDPRVEITLLQGEPLLDYLDDMDHTFAGEDRDSSLQEVMGAASLSYFAGRPLPETNPQLAHVGPNAPLWIEIGIPAEEGLRAACAIGVQSLEDDRSATSDAVFVTGVRGHLIPTDIPPDLLRPEARDVLMGLAETGLDLEQLAREQGQEVRQIWKSLVAATEELGAPSVEDAAIAVDATRHEQEELVAGI